MTTHCSSHNRSASGILFALISSLACLAAFAQDGGTKNPPPVLSAADQKWAELQALFIPPSQREQPAVTDAESRVRARKWQAERFLKAAEEAKAFAKDFPDSDHALEATRLEAKNILQAAMAGDVSQEGRARELLGQIRVDERLPARARLEVVALSELVRLRPLFPDREKFLPAYEQAIRNQIMEFSTEPAAYESLLRFAENLPVEADTVRVAQEIATEMPAPESVKAAAREVLAKNALVGQPLDGLLESAIGKTPDLRLVGSGQRQTGGTVIYTWSLQSAGSMAAAKNLAKMLPANVTLLGVNVDKDEADAKAVAEKEALPGKQLYDARGYDGAVAQALKLRKLGEVYVIDTRGVIRSVSAQHGDLTAKLGYASK